MGPLLGVVAVLVLGEWAFGPQIVQWAIPAREIPHDDDGYMTHDPIGAIVARRCRDAGVPLVRLGVVDDGVPNAFAFGRTRRSARVWVTRGLLDRLDEHELDAVVAHELGHVRNRDFVLMTIAAVVPLLLYALARALIDADDDDGDDDGDGVLLGLAVFVCYLVCEFVVLWLSRTREFAADHWSCECTGNGDALGVRAREDRLRDDRQLCRAPRSPRRWRRTRVGVQGSCARWGSSTRAPRGAWSTGSSAVSTRSARSPRCAGKRRIPGRRCSRSCRPIRSLVDASPRWSSRGWPVGRPGWDCRRLASAPTPPRPGASAAQFVVDLTAVVLPWLTLLTALILLFGSGPTPWQAGLLLVGSGVLFALAMPGGTRSSSRR